MNTSIAIETKSRRDSVRGRLLGRLCLLLGDGLMSAASPKTERSFARVNPAVYVQTGQTAEERAATRRRLLLSRLVAGRHSRETGWRGIPEPRSPPPSRGASVAMACITAPRRRPPGMKARSQKRPLIVTVTQYLRLLRKAQ